MRRNQKRTYSLVAFIIILAILSVFPQKTQEYHITQKGPIVFIGEGFDGGFKEIKVGSTIFENPVVPTSSNSYVSLPPHLHTGEEVVVSGDWSATRPWWMFGSPTPPHVVRLTRISVLSPKT